MNFPYVIIMYTFIYSVDSRTHKAHTVHIHMQTFTQYITTCRNTHTHTNLFNLNLIILIVSVLYQSSIILIHFAIQPTI